jgi:hypothetical protein
MLRPGDLGRDRRADGLALVGLPACLGLRDVGADLLDEPQRLGQRRKARVGTGAAWPVLACAGGQEGRVDAVGFGPASVPGAKAMHLAGLEHDHVEARPAQGAHERALIAARGLQAHARDAPGLARLQESRVAFGSVGQLCGGLAGEGEVEAVLADVDASGGRAILCHLRQRLLGASRSTQHLREP